MRDEKEADLNLAPAVLVEAHVYKVKKTGKLMYCSNKHPVEAQDHEYMGTANVNENEVLLCEFEDA